jgi:hypothetical protein
MRAAAAAAAPAWQRLAHQHLYSTGAAKVTTQAALDTEQVDFHVFLGANLTAASPICRGLPLI